MTTARVVYAHISNPAKKKKIPEREGYTDKNSDGKLTERSWLCFVMQVFNFWKEVLNHPLHTLFIVVLVVVINVDFLWVCNRLRLFTVCMAGFTPVTRKTKLFHAAYHEVTERRGSFLKP